MFKEIVSVSGKSGLYRLVSKASNLMIIESLTDKKRIPAYTRDKPVLLADVSIFIDDGEVFLGEVLTKIKEKEDGKNIPFDFSKVDNDTLRGYLSEVLPTFDRERVYPSDIRKLLKWYDLLIGAGIVDYASKEEEKPAVVDNPESREPTEEAKETQKNDAPASPKLALTKRKDNSMISVKSAQAPKAKPMPKNATPKKNIVGSKRGG